MRSASLFAGLFATAAIASPLAAVEKRSSDSDPCDAPPCMTKAQAQHVANNFKTLIADYSNATANAVLTANYQDFADSVGELINGGCPDGPITLGQATFPTRTAFEAGQGSQPPIPFNFLNLWHTCDTVIFRWDTTPTPNATEKVTGIIVLETEYDASNTANPFLISTSYSEFNSGAWLVDLGVFVPTCNATAAPPSKRDVPELPFRMA